MESQKLIRKQMAIALLAVAICHAPLMAEAAPGVALADKAMPKTQVIANLKNRVDVESTIGELSSWDEKDIGRLKVFELLKGLLADAATLKADRQAILDYFQTAALDDGVLPYKDLAELLIARLRAENSPNLSLKMVELLLSLDQIGHIATEKEVGKLIEEIIQDSTLASKDQKYAHLHAVTFAAIGEGNASAKVAKALVTLIKKVEKLEPVLQQSVCLALASLLRSTNARKNFVKDDKIACFDALLAWSGKNPAHVPGAAGQMREHERDSLVAAVSALDSLAGDSDIKDKEVSNAAELFGKVLEHPDAQIQEKSGQFLLTAYFARADKKPSVDVPSLLLENAKKRLATSAGEKEKPAGLTSFRLLLAAMPYLYATKSKESQSQSAKILGFMREQFLSNTDIDFKKLARQAYFELEPNVFQQKILGEEAAAVCRKFFDECVEVMAMDSAGNEAMRAFQENCAAVLFEMTGKDFGSEAFLWKQWIKEDGSKFFK